MIDRLMADLAIGSAAQESEGESDLDLSPAAFDDRLHAGLVLARDYSAAVGTWKNGFCHVCSRAKHGSVWNANHGRLLRREIGIRVEDPSSRSLTRLLDKRCPWRGKRHILVASLQRGFVAFPDRSGRIRSPDSEIRCA